MRRLTPPLLLRDFSADPQTLPAGGLVPGARLAGLRLERVLARGAVGTLWLAVDEASATPLALKVVPLETHAGSGRGLARASFEREAHHARQLDHPGIVTVYGTLQLQGGLQGGLQGELQGLGCIVMELLAGTDLTHHNRPHRLLPVPQVLVIAARLAQALAYAHRRGIVHRDVKPANVMFDPVSDILKLTDFGLARATDAAATGTGLLPGSPAYMAPEQLAGEVPTAGTDIYALGVMLFELLAGRLPHEGHSMGDLLHQVARVQAPDLQQLRPDLPSGVASLVARMLAKAAIDRPPDGDVLASELQRQSRALTGVGVKSR